VVFCFALCPAFGGEQLYRLTRVKPVVFALLK